MPPRTLLIVTLLAFTANQLSQPLTNSPACMRAIIFLGLIPTCLSLNILLFLIGSNQFERNTFEFVAQQLALRHHNVITVKPILIPEEPRLVKPKLHLVREKTLKNMLPKALYEPLEKVGNDIPWRQTYEEEEHMKVYWTAHNASCHKMLNSNLLDTLKQDSLDVAIIYAGNPCQLALTHVLAVPTIYFDVEGLTDETLVASGTPLDLDVPASHCTLPEVSPTFQRIRNGLCYLKEYIAQSGLPILPGLVSERYKMHDSAITSMFAEDYTIKKRFKVFPDVNQLKQESVLFFANTDPLLEFPRALPPHVIPVGGIHLDHPKPLFSPWNTTIEAAEEGMIVVSLGTQANSTAMTNKQAKSILGALSKLTKYRIYWRVGPTAQLPGIKEEDVPSHINLTTFLPQNDLLAHKSCRLLVTNGGMSSVMEAVAYGVPVVGIPLYGTNRHNLAKVANKGLGLIINKPDLTEASLLKAMKSVLDSAKYKTVAKEMSKEFKSRATNPFALALHHIEHVGRHHKAAFFAPSSTNPLRTLNLDFIAALLLIIWLITYIPCKLLGFCRSNAPKSCPVSSSTPKSKKETKKD